MRSVLAFIVFAARSIGWDVYWPAGQSHAVVTDHHGQKCRISVRPE